MRSRSRRRVAWSALGLTLAAVGAGGPARAQTSDDPSELFGGLEAAGRANGIQLTYDVEGVFPLPAPLFQASVPEASTTMQSGPTTTALGSVAYPGNVLANLPAIVAQSSPEAAPYVPPYPVLSRAEHPAGPPEAGQDIGSASSRVRAEPSLAQAVTTMGAGDLLPFAQIGAITTSAQTGIVDGLLETRSRVELTGVSLLFGLLRIEALVTDLVATSDGETAATAGGTTASGVTFLGLPATLGPDGIDVAEPEPPSGPGPLTPLVDGVGDLSPVADALSEAAAPLNAALQQVLGTTDASVNELLAATGISIRTMEPLETLDGPAGSRVANGLVIDLDYDGRGENPLAQLLGAIPSEQLPADSIPGFPLNTSPQALVNLLKEHHVVGMALGYGNVDVEASPAFSFELPDLGGIGGTGALGGGSPAVGGAFAPPSFSTPAPELPGAEADAGGVDGLPVGVTAGGAAAAVVLALLTTPLWAIGSRALADNVLGVAASTCPEGLDAPLKGA